jgi:NAD(P)H-hydrate epimerase
MKAKITSLKYVAAVLPRRRADANKGDFGKVLVIAGSAGMMGAAVLTARAALRTGSGLVTLCVPDRIKNVVNSMSLETIVAGFSQIDEKLNDCDAVAIGPGLSKRRAIHALLKKVLFSKKIKVPIIIDADGLNAVSDPSIFKKSGKEIIITPHPGEFARLTKKSIKSIQKDRIASASDFAAKFGVTVILKGADSVISGKGRTFVNPVRNPGMATAGAGDVLTGIIASLAGQGVDAFNSAVAGAYIHGMAGNMATSIKGERGVIASDIIDCIPLTLKSIIKRGLK